MAVANPTATVPSTADTTATAAVAPTTSTDPTTALTAAANVTTTDVAQTSGPLSDVPTGHWAYDAVAELVKDGLIVGYPDGLFKGNRPMTRYEAAVLAYRAVDQIEAQITAGKAVLQRDIDAANKLIAAFGSELKAVEAHVDALQKQADATNSKLAATTAVANATAATVRKQQIHISMFVRAFNYSQNISANAGPLGATATCCGPTVVAPGGSIPAYSGSAPTGSAVTGPLAYNPATGTTVPGSAVSGGISWGTQQNESMGNNSNTIGNQNHGLGMEYLTLGFGGNPDDHSQWLLTLKQTYRFNATNFYPSISPAYCTAAAIGTAGAACSSANSSLSIEDGQVSALMKLQDAWYQYTTPGGFYAKVGKFSQDEGPKQIGSTSWTMIDYLNGARVGYRNATLNMQIGYGYDDPAAASNYLYGVPASQQLMYGEADYQLDHGRTDIGVDYNSYSGFHQILYDPYAVMCLGTTPATPAVANLHTGTVTPATTGTVGTSKIIPLVNGQVFTAGGCGAGYAPIVYGQSAGGLYGPAAGSPITGAYVSTGAGAAYPNINTLALFAVENYGPLRLVLEGTDRLGNDPFTQSRWAGAYSVFFQADIGAGPVPLPGVKGKPDFEIGGFEAGFNSLSESMAYYVGSSIWANFTTDPSGYAFLFAGLKYYLTDTASIGVFGAHLGLLPNQIEPASSPNCPGCSITGDSRNAIWGEFNMAF